MNIASRLAAVTVAALLCWSASASAQSAPPPPAQNLPPPQRAPGPNTYGPDELVNAGHRFFGGGEKALPPPVQATDGQNPQGQDQDPKKKKGLFGKIAGIFKDDKSSTPPPKPPDPSQTAPH